MTDIDPQWATPDGKYPAKEELRDQKYPPGIPRPGVRIPTNARSSNLGVIGFETDDDEMTQKILDHLTEELLKLKRHLYPTLVWNATEEHYRTRWTRFQMIGDKKSTPIG